MCSFNWFLFFFTLPKYKTNYATKHVYGRVKEIVNWIPSSQHWENSSLYIIFTIYLFMKYWLNCCTIFCCCFNLFRFFVSICIILCSIATPYNVIYANTITCICSNEQWEASVATRSWRGHCVYSCGPIHNDW